MLCILFNASIDQNSQLEDLILMSGGKRKLCRAGQRERKVGLPGARAALPAQLKGDAGRTTAAATAD